MLPFHIEPANARVPLPGTVRFNVENAAGQQPRTLAVEGPRGEVLAETNLLRPGQSTVLTADLDRPGRYTWYCPDYRELGMEGTITVEGA